MATTTNASLVLEDGTTFRGRVFGANVSVSGEVGKMMMMCKSVSSLNLKAIVNVSSRC